MGPATRVELLHLAAGLIVTYAVVASAAWAYPAGRVAIWSVGAVTLLAVLAMSVPELAKARAADRG